jgi:hypothetical protein
MSLLLKMIGLNQPLHTWQKFKAAEAQKTKAGVSSSELPFYGFGEKHLNNVATVVVASLTHDEAIKLVVCEWENLPSVVRMRITQLANERYHNPSSHNQVKGIKRLDKLLDGKILSKAEGPTERHLGVVDGRLVSTQRAIKSNVAGAERAFAAFVKPRDFQSWSPARKRAWQNEMAARRRQR